MIVKKLSMKEQCYEIMKERILRGEYELGEEINIVKLSTELMVSNTPIREALSLLEADGLVVTSLNVRAQVVLLTSTSFNDIVQSVYVLVKGAFELCVREGRIDECLELMEKSLIEQKRLLARKDSHEFVKESIHFDRIIFDALGNPHLSFLFERLSNVLFLMYRTNHQREDWDHSRSILEHQMIVDAIKKGEHEEVERLFNIHYHQTYTEE